MALAGARRFKQWQTQARCPVIEYGFLKPQVRFPDIPEANIGFRASEDAFLKFQIPIISAVAMNMNTDAHSLKQMAMLGETQRMKLVDDPEGEFNLVLGGMAGWWKMKRLCDGCSGSLGIWSSDRGMMNGHRVLLRKPNMKVVTLSTTFEEEELRVLFTNLAGIVLIRFKLYESNTVYEVIKEFFVRTKDWLAFEPRQFQYKFVTQSGVPLEGRETGNMKMVAVLGADPNFAEDSSPMPPIIIKKEQDEPATPSLLVAESHGAEAGMQQIQDAHAALRRSNASSSLTISSSSEPSEPSSPAGKGSISNQSRQLKRPAAADGNSAPKRKRFLT